jgi:hypothetical protein
MNTTGGAAAPAVDTRMKARLGAARRTLTEWWVFTAEPKSLKEMYRASAVDMTRIPAGKGRGRAASAWRGSNFFDRSLLLLFLLLTPGIAQGPVRWCFERPTRRWGLYVIVGVLVAWFTAVS